MRSHTHNKIKTTPGQGTPLTNEASSGTAGLSTDRTTREEHLRETTLIQTTSKVSVDKVVSTLPSTRIVIGTLRDLAMKIRRIIGATSKAIDQGKTSREATFTEPQSRSSKETLKMWSENLIFSIRSNLQLGSTIDHKLVISRKLWCPQVQERSTCSPTSTS